MRGYPEHLHELIAVDTQENIYDETLNNWLGESCNKCNSEKIDIFEIVYEDGEISADSYDAICSDCGHEFIIVYL